MLLNFKRLKSSFTPTLVNSQRLEYSRWKKMHLLRKSYLK